MLYKYILNFQQIENFKPTEIWYTWNVQFRNEKDFWHRRESFSLKPRIGYLGHGCPIFHQALAQLMKAQTMQCAIIHTSGNIEQHYLTIAGHRVASLAYFSIQTFQKNNFYFK